MSLPDLNPTLPPPPTDDHYDPDIAFSDDDDDIYRGPAPPSPRQSTISLSSSSSSSSGSFLGVARLGAIANVLEHALTRWARGGSSSASSSSSSSESSKSSIVTLSKSQIARRRRRRPSMGNFHSDQSERDIAARISLIKAREQSRQVPREFCLYLPPAYRAFVTSEHPEDSTLKDTQRVTLSSSLPFILGQLDTALKKASKARRRAARSPSPFPMHHDFMLPESLKVPSRAASFTDLRTAGFPGKGKQRERESRDTTKRAVDLTDAKTWYLDVASPTSADMHAIGKLLHLHPLTLEDILQQDPREKVEVFPKLGYYFISFRAIEGKSIRGSLHARLNGHKGERTDDSFEEGVLGEANVYLVVFNEGICSFHFNDISEHTDHVRNRLFQLEGVQSLSAAWIAYGLLDSLVDSFFPFLEEIEREVVDIEDLVFSYGRKGTGSQETLVEKVEPSLSQPSPTARSLDDQESARSIIFEKPSSERISVRQTHFALHRPPLPLLFRRLRRFLRAKHNVVPPDEPITHSPKLRTLRRMAKARRLVTSLTRLLAVKSDIVLQFRKRLLVAGAARPDKGNESADIAIYLGDVHDHILTLQHSLAHYERLLSQSHPSYLNQLRTSAELTKQGTDKAIIILTVVSIGALCVQPITGVMSINVNMPANGLSTDDPYNVFGIIIALVFISLLTYGYAARRWWNQAKLRRATAI